MGETTKATGDVLRSGRKLAIIRALDESEKSFSDLLKQLRMTSGNLNYHLLTLHRDNLLFTVSSGKYSLTPTGHEVADIIRRIQSSGSRQS